MGIRNQNSTNYVHPDEPNLLDLHKAMEYNLAGAPVLRTHIDGVTLQGDVFVDAVRIWDGTHYVSLEQPTNDSEPGGWSISTENYNMVFNGSTWDRMRGNTTDGVFTSITNDYLPISKDTNANSDSNRIYVNASGTVELGSTTLSALETITVNQGTDPWNVTGNVTIDSGTIDANLVYPEGVSDYYNEPFAVQLTPIMQLNSYEGVRTRDSQTYSGGGGAVTPNDNEIVVSCTNTVGSYGVYRSRRFIPYKPGQSCSARILAKFSAGVALTQQRVGIQNQESAYYLGLNGATNTLQFLHVSGGNSEKWQLTVANTASTDQTITLTLNSTVYSIAIASGDTVTKISQKISTVVNATATWLADTVNNTVRLLFGGANGALGGTFTCTSTGNVTGTLLKKSSGVADTNEWQALNTYPSWLNTTQWTNYQIQYGPQGTLVFALNPNTNDWVLIHRHFAPSEGLGAKKSTFKVAAVAYNVGGSAGVNLSVAELSGYIEGIDAVTTLTRGGGITQTSLTQTTNWHVMSIQNPYINEQWKLNLRSVLFEDLSVAVQCNDPVEVSIYFNQPLAAGNVFEWVSDRGQAVYQASTVKAEMDVSGDTPVISFTVGTTGAGLNVDLKKYNLLLPPGTHMSLVAYSTAAIQKITISGSWAMVG